MYQVLFIPLNNPVKHRYHLCFIDEVTEARELEEHYQGHTALSGGVRSETQEFSDSKVDFSPDYLILSSCKILLP